MIQRLITASCAAFLALMSQDVAAQDAGVGAELYQHYCATCHGLDATGHGPMAGILVIQPTNLRTLADEEGVFPTARVVARIDGARSSGQPWQPDAGLRPLF